MENELTPVITPVLRAADCGGTVSDEPTDEVVHMVTAYGPTLATPRRLTREGRTLWGQTFANVLERAVVETFELYATHARVRRCRFCHSVFVPWRDEHVCRWNLWTTPMNVGQQAVQHRSAKRQIEADRASQPRMPRQAYDLERKRLWTRYARARKAALERGEKKPEANKRVKEAKKDLSDFIEANGPDLGRPRTRKEPENARDAAPARVQPRVRPRGE